ALLIAVIAPAAPARAADFVPGEVVVQVKPGVDIGAIAARLGLRILAQSAYAPTYRLGVPLGVNVPLVAALLQLLPDVIAADPNYLLRGLQQTDGNQWTYTFNGDCTSSGYQGQTAPSQVHFQSAARKASGSGVTIAILDTGL